jgi:hypothetical protein
MKCPECNFENGDDFIFCTNCGNKLKTNDSDDIGSSNDLNLSTEEKNTIEHLCSKYNINPEGFFDDRDRIVSDDSDKIVSDDQDMIVSDDYDRIFSDNNFTIGQINKIKSFMEENDDEDGIKKLIQDEISNNKYCKQLSDKEYKLLLEFSKKVMWDDLNGKGISFTKDNGLKTVTRTEMRTVKEEVPVVKQKHGALTKGAATFGFGLIGLAGTSGVKTEMKTVEKQVPVQVERNVKDIANVTLMLNDNRLEIKENNSKSIFNFSEIVDITYENRFIYIKANNETIMLEQKGKYFSDLITDALSENIYYLKDYSRIKTLYFDDFSKDLHNAWISKILSYDVDDNEPSELDKIDLIKKYHELKESGIITEEEFEKKKQELLN